MKFLPTYELEVETNDNEKVKIGLPFSIEFEVTRKWLASANTALFRISNLAEETRNRLYHDQYDNFNPAHWRAIQFRAGYPDSPLPLLFNGNVMRCISFRRGNTFTTEIWAYDGQIAMINGFSSRTVGAGAGAKQILQGLIADLPNLYGSAIIGTFDQINARGEVLFGNTWTLIGEKSGGKAVIDNGQVKILNDSEVIAGEIPLISSDSGLLGSPIRADAMIEVPILFEPRLTLGQLVGLQSSTNAIFNREFKVMGIEHRGTISTAVDGERITTASLGFGTQALKIISGGAVQ